MAQPTYIARKGEDADFKALTVDSLTINTATIAAGAVVLADDEKITLGTSLDVTVEWDTAATPDELQLVPLADDTVIGFGKSAATQLAFDIRWLANEANGASSVYFDASANLVYTTGVDVQVKDDDFLVFGNGAGAAGDVQLEWDTAGTPDALLLTATADDTLFAIGDGTLSFDVKIFQGAAGNYFLFDASDNALEMVGDSRIDLSGATIAAANTDGGVIKIGTSAAKVTEDTADMKFVSMYFDCGATSGDARGIYDRLYITGAGGGGESLRAYTDVLDVAGATAHGAHISLGLGASGSVTGQGIGTRSTLHMPATALAAGNVTYAALQAEIYSDATTSDPAGNKLSLLRLVNDGVGGGPADVDDDAAAIEFTGFTVGDGNMIAVKAGAAGPNVTHSIRIRLPDGSAAYLYAGATPLTA